VIPVLLRFVLVAGMLNYSARGIDLKGHLVGPAVAGESNFYLDLWQPAKMRMLAPSSGLTNNHALFINSHGKGVKTKHRQRFVFYPHEDISTGQFFIEDIAAALGRDNVSKIHNLIIGACDTDSTFSVAEVRKYFPNATNIIHSARGEAGYQEMLFQMLVAESSQVETLYQARAPEGDFDFTNHPVAGAKKMSPYVASLFLPGQRKPYRTQKAGRELLTQVPISEVVPVITLE